MITENSKEVNLKSELYESLSLCQGRIENGYLIEQALDDLRDEMEEAIDKEMSERQKLLDSNRELIEILEKISQWRKLKRDVFTYANGDGNNFDNQIKNAINNAKNI